MQEEKLQHIPVVDAIKRYMVLEGDIKNLLTDSEYQIFLAFVISCASEQQRA